MAGSAGRNSHEARLNIACFTGSVINFLSDYWLGSLLLFLTLSADCVWGMGDEKLTNDGTRNEELKGGAKVLKSKRLQTRPRFLFPPQVTIKEIKVKAEALGIHTGPRLRLFSWGKK